MKLYTTLQIGAHHIHHCEDYLVTAPLGTEKTLCAVMDGCSMGKDSYLVATLTGKILRKVAKEIAFREFAEKRTTILPDLLKTILRQLFHELKQLKNTLQLERNELLTTLVIAVIDAKEKAGEFMCIGDGVIDINGNLYEFDQDNKPDYLGYHLQEDFEHWFSVQQQRLSEKGIINFSLCTDGIFTFSRFDNNIYEPSGNIIAWLLTDDTYNENEHMLSQKVTEVKMNWGLVPTDDLAIVRGYLGD
ncbi:protein phosphatase 2C-like protein [Chitinophaga polysaccharea]|uniref:Protein phosphatase 2C-like protein n=1 Tax=Chitinophaga polysaccharea TaxID=1293035 RepID=A0A561PQU1_9BACT|nr:protein phosphatase 2C domain-containing protein [Chitinophaga polysaccharea]TWF40478.1 protein phosphatase 2C-like protein [Chitinophaga polysaccharea]